MRFYDDVGRHRGRQRSLQRPDASRIYTRLRQKRGRLASVTLSLARGVSVDLNSTRIDRETEREESERQRDRERREREERERQTERDREREREV